MKTPQRAFITLILVVLWSGCDPENHDIKPVAYETHRCSFEAPTTPVLAGVECGTLRVPATTTSDEAELPVLRLRTASPSRKDDPVLFIAGGPGQSATNVLKENFSTDPFRQLLMERDLIALDLRGTGNARPSLACEDLQSRQLSDRQFTKGEGDEAIRLCRALLGSKLRRGLGQFGSELDASDIHSLVQALNLGAWNVYAVSYGTRVVQRLLARKPAGLRAVVADSPLPLGVTAVADGAKRSAQIIRGLIESCATDLSCAESFPNLENELRSTLAKLAESPRVLTSPSSKNIHLDDSEFVDMLRMLVSSSEGSSYLPYFIHQNATETSEAAAMVQELSASRTMLPMGLYLSIVCSEIESRPKAVAFSNDLEAQLVNSSLSIQAITHLCSLWELPSKPVLTLPVSDVPLRVLIGNYDPLIPAGYATQFASSAAGAEVVPFAGAGHTVGSDPCGAISVAQFFSSPGLVAPPACSTIVSTFDFFTDGQ